MKLEIFVTPTTSVDIIADTFPTRNTDKLLHTDDRSGVVTLEITGHGISDAQIAWIDAQKMQGTIERIATR